MEKTKETKEIRVYYAHSKKIYNSEREKNEYLFIKNIYPKTLCPNKDIGELGSLKPYLDIVKTMDLIIFSEYMNFIGKGVYAEIQTAIINKIPIKLFRNNNLLNINKLEINNKNDWAIKFAKVIL